VTADRGEGTAAGRKVGFSIALGCLSLVAAHAAIFSDAPGAGLAEGVEEVLFVPTSAAPGVVVLCWLWMCWVRWPRLRSFGGREAPASGALLLGSGGALCVWSHYVGVPTLLVPSLSLVSLGTALFLGGGGALRTMLYPAAFLLLAMPLPTPLVNEMIYPAQVANAAMVGSFLSALGFDVGVSGDLVRVGSVVAQVIEGCTGVRSTLAVLMAACIYTELAWHDRRRTMLLIALSPLIAFGANFIRILSIIFNPYATLSAVHSAQGLLMVVGSILVLALLDGLLARVWKTAPEPHLVVEAAGGRPPLLVAASFAILALTIALVSFAGPRWSPPEDLEVEPVTSIRGGVEGWSAVGFKPDYEFLGSTRFDSYAARSYSRRDSAEIRLLVAADHRLDPARGLGSAKAAIPGRGGVILTRPDGVGGPRSWIRAEVIRFPEEVRLVYFWSVGSASLLEETFRSVFGLDRSPFRRPGREAFVQISTSLEDGLEAASARLDFFVSEFRDDFVKTDLWLD